MFFLNDTVSFPPADEASEEGLVAIGGDLSPQRLLSAYKNGIFPWYNEDEPILWWSPNPRFVLFPDKLKISKSMRTVLQNGTFKFTTNRCFAEVINTCKSTPRKNEPGTWINMDMVNAYAQLHALGYAHSAETWQNGNLVGGLYGVRIGNIFFGESMFSKVSNASKFAFINYINQLKKEGVQLIDCQMHTDHLESLGACMIERKEFINLLQQYC